MTVSTISVPDMHCSACSSKIRTALKELTGVKSTYFNPTRRHVLVEHTPEVPALELLKRIEDVGFSPALTGVEAADAAQKLLLKRLGVAGIAMMQVMMLAIALYAGALDEMQEAYRRLLEFTSLLFCIPVVTYSAVPFFSGALRAARTGVNMDVPIALAIAIAFSVSLANTLSGAGHVYYDSVVMFTFLLLGARYVDGRLRRRFGSTDSALAALPVTAERLAAGRQETVALADLASGDQVWIQEGAMLPVDGRLDDAQALVDEAMLTGEADWVRKAEGSDLWGGTINRGAAFAMTATAAADSSRIADIAALARRAELERPPQVLLADRIAGYFIPAVLSLAAITFVTWQLLDPQRALVAALTVLVVSCPCALSLATPAALTAAMTRLREAGLVLTRSAALEQAAATDLALIDKTGTLTVHEPQLERVELLSGRLDEATCLALAGALQQHSSHPLAQAFRGHGGVRLSDLETVPGKGVRGRWDGSELRIGSPEFCGAPATDADRDVLLAVDGHPVCRFVITDKVREDARDAVVALKALDVEPVMVSGDSETRCGELAGALGLAHRSRQTPESKLAFLKARAVEGRNTLMLGDGINDVPVLAGAALSAAVVEASDLVKSRADVLLLSRRLEPVAELIRVARRTRRITRQNLAWAAAYNLTAIPIAALGLMPPWLAAIGMASSSTLVMLNATRILR